MPLSILQVLGQEPIGAGRALGWLWKGRSGTHPTFFLGALLLQGALAPSCPESTASSRPQTISWAHWETAIQVRLERLGEPCSQRVLTVTNKRTSSGHLTGLQILISSTRIIPNPDKTSGLLQAKKSNTSQSGSKTTSHFDIPVAVAQSEDNNHYWPVLKSFQKKRHFKR